MTVRLMPFPFLLMLYEAKFCTDSGTDRGKLKLDSIGVAPVDFLNRDTGSALNNKKVKYSSSRCAKDRIISFIIRLPLS